VSNGGAAGGENDTRRLDADENTSSSALTAPAKAARVELAVGDAGAGQGVASGFKGCEQKGGREREGRVYLLYKGCR